MKHILNLALACAVLLPAGPALGEIAAGLPQPSGAGSALAGISVQRETLDNGLRVVLNVDHTVPTVAVAIYYDVGSRNEEQGRSGFAHLFEHMMFQGSANVEKGQHFSLIMNRGGSMNGTTGEDRTNYFETLPSNELALGLFLEADRMRSLRITQENFDNQRATVIEERRQRVDNQPYAPSMLRINELAYGSYWPYSHSTIGEVQDLENAPLEAVRQFHDAYYAPNNAVLSISGDFEPAQAMALVRQYFATIPRHDVPAYQPGPLAPQTAERRETMHDALAELPAFHIAYHIPPARSADHYALELLSTILGDGESSRLYQKLVKEDELCQDVQVSTDDRRGPDLFSFWGLMAHGHEPAEAQRVIFSELDHIAQAGITPRELEKAKNRMNSAFVFGLQSNLQRARNLAEFELYFGDAGLLRAELARYTAVTAEDVKRVAARYFPATNRTVLDIVPGPADAAEAAPAAAEGHFAVPQSATTEGGLR